MQLTDGKITLYPPVVQAATELNLNQTALELYCSTVECLKPYFKEAALTIFNP